jgi:thiol-disulfide isomerase/thioredoxin
MGIKRMNMKKQILILCMIFFFHAANSQQVAKYKIQDVVKYMDTATVPLVVNFWASWCKPCVEEIPWFEKAVAEYAKDKVRLLLVSLDFEEDYPNGIIAFAKKKGYRSSLAWLDETNADEFCPAIDPTWSGAIPATVFVNKAFNYRLFIGHQIPEPRLALELKKLVGEK